MEKTLRQIFFNLVYKLMIKKNTSHFYLLTFDGVWSSGVVVARQTPAKHRGQCREEFSARSESSIFSIKLKNSCAHQNKHTYKIAYFIKKVLRGSIGAHLAKYGRGKNKLIYRGRFAPPPQKKTHTTKIRDNLQTAAPAGLTSHCVLTPQGEGLHWLAAWPTSPTTNTTLNTIICFQAWFSESWQFIDILQWLLTSMRRFD